MVERIQNLIKEAIPVENYPGITDWHITPEIQGVPRFKFDSFQNINFPAYFLLDLAIDHLLCSQYAETFVDEYKKFLYLAHVLRSTHNVLRKRLTVFGITISTILKNILNFLHLKWREKFLHTTPLMVLKRMEKCIPQFMIKLFLIFTIILDG